MCSQYNDTMYDSLSIWRDVMSLALSLVTFERAEPAVGVEQEQNDVWHRRSTLTFWHIGT